MTRLQFDNTVWKIQNLIEKQGCAAIKATFDRTAFDNFEEHTGIAHIAYEYSYMGNHTVYVYILILNKGNYNLAEWAGYCMSEFAFYGAKKIEAI